MLTTPLRQVIKHYLPTWLLRWRKRRKWEPIRQYYGALKVSDCFSEIYHTKLWGEADGEAFCSGGGSSAHFAIPYLKQVHHLIAEHKIRTVVDLGCGDFRVGRLLCAQLLEIPIPGDVSVMRTVLVEGLPDRRSHVLRESA